MEKMKEIYITSLNIYQIFDFENMRKNGNIFDL